MLNNLIGGLFTTLSKQASTIIDETVTTKEEKWKLKNELTQIINEAEKNASQEVSNRWQYDMQWGNKLSKSIRPLTLIFLTLVFTIISFADGNIGGFQLNKDFLPIWNTILLSVYSAYFVGRSIEKVKQKQ
mgnify:CR=1 FL=1|tara:strand:- start:987 stop:1379 length:393 start_codon:yes stop_codon:yes gene_type:complete